MALRFAILVLVIAVWTAVLVLATTDSEPTVDSFSFSSSPTANDNATRAAMYWRHMIGRYPQAAAQASMYWRIMSAEDPEGAAKATMEMRKATSADPEGMAQMALRFHRLAQQGNNQFDGPSDTYWRKMAAHDPEVTARSAMYWRNDKETAMYW